MPLLVLNKRLPKQGSGGKKVFKFSQTQRDIYDDTKRSDSIHNTRNRLAMVFRRPAHDGPGTDWQLDRRADGPF